jgi:hypothetical protein
MVINLIDIRNSIYNELLKANLHFQIYWQLEDIPEELAKTQKRYLTFFLFSKLAHLQSFCLAIYNATKDLEDTGNIPKLIRLIETDCACDMGKVKEKYYSHLPLIEKIQNARTKFIAHDLIKKGRKPIIIKDVLKMIEIPCKQEEGSKLLSDLEDVFDSLNQHCEKGHHYAFKVTPSPNTIELLNVLYEYDMMKMKKGLGRTDN